MADELIRFKFDLDAKEALEHLTSIRDTLTKIGDVKSIDQVSAAFGKMGPALGIALGAALAVKAAFDLTLEGEAIEKINKQFETLASQAGLSAIALRDGIEKSVDGLVDLDSALQASSGAIVKLGANAEKIPQIFELARKVSSVFGGDVVANFDAISQAISSGNARLLKSMGLTIDADKAYAKYAATIGTVKTALGDAERKTALLNEVLLVGQTRFGAINLESESATATWTRLKISLKELVDALAVFVAKTGVVKVALDTLNAVVKSTGNFLKESFGEPVDAVNNKIRRLSGEIKELEKSLDDAQKGKSNWLTSIFGAADTNLISDRIEKLKTELIALNEEKKKIESEAPKVEGEKPEAKGGISEETRRQIIAQENKFQNELLQIKQSRIKSEQEVETNAQEFMRLQNEQRLVIEEQFNQKILELRDKSQGDSATLTAAQSAQMIVEIEREKNAKLLDFDRQRDQLGMQVYENQLKSAKTASEGIVAAFKQGGAQGQKDLKDFGKIGTIAFESVKGGAARFFKGLGEGSKDAGDLMREFLFGSIADVAEAQGKFLLSSGIGMMEPVQIAEGGALLALAGFLRSQAGGGGGGGGGAGGGGGGAAIGGAVGGMPEMVKPIAQETPKKTVTVNFLGDYLSTEQTQKRLVELIRQETDATDYKYQQIGVR